MNAYSSRRERTTGRAAALAAVLALVAVLAHPLSVTGQQPAQVEVDRAAALAPDGYFKILLVEGSVRVRAWDRDSVRVRGSMSAEARRGFYFGASGSAGKMGLQTTGDGTAQLEVTVPRRATVWVKTTAGGITVSGTEGMLDLYSVTGHVEVEGSPRSAYAESMAGDVVVRGRPGTLRVKTGSGSITVIGGSPDLDLSTVSGAVTVTAEEPLRRARLETVGGRVGLAAPVDRGGAITIRTHDGPVELDLPQGTDADVLLATLEGLLTTAREKLAAKPTGLKGREVTFSLGDGGAEITVHTFSGNVSVK